MSNKLKWIALSFGVNIALMAIKFAAFYLTNSNAILSDALESIINVIASSIAFYSIYLSSLPRDPNHPYGHGKIEYFSSGFEGALIFMAGVFIAYQSVIRFYNPEPIEKLPLGSILVFFSAVVNGFLGYFLVKEGRKSRSEALMADGKHLLTDTYSSIIILVGFGLIYVTGYESIDSIVSLLLSFVIFYNGFKLMRTAAGALMDEHDPELMEAFVILLNTHKKPEWIDVHNFRVQKYGSDLHIDCHLTLPYYWSLADVHEYVHDFEQKIIQNIEGRVEVFVHTDPCLPECCHYCSIQNCVSRKHKFEENIVWTSQNLTTNHKHFVV